MRGKEGYLTVYLALCLTVILSLYLALIDSARRNGAGLEALCAAEAGMQSVMAEYHRELSRQYNLFAVDSSYGTKFHNFVDRLVSMEEEYTWKWMETTGSRMEPEGEMTKEFYHIMTTSYFEGIFEVVRHQMGREDAKKYVAMMGKYHHAGFLAIAGNE